MDNLVAKNLEEAHMNAKNSIREYLYLLSFEDLDAGALTEMSRRFCTAVTDDFILFGIARGYDKGLQHDAAPNSVPASNAVSESTDTSTT